RTLNNNRQLVQTHSQRVYNLDNLDNLEPNQVCQVFVSFKAVEALNVIPVPQGVMCQDLTNNMIWRSIGNTSFLLNFPNKYEISHYEAKLCTLFPFPTNDRYLIINHLKNRSLIEAATRVNDNEYKALFQE
ncbi:14151_t:CDS:1, partial [Racocetra fulgida]